MHFQLSQRVIQYPVGLKGDTLPFWVWWEKVSILLTKKQNKKWYQIQQTEKIWKSLRVHWITFEWKKGKCLDAFSPLKYSVHISQVNVHKERIGSKMDVGGGRREGTGGLSDFEQRKWRGEYFPVAFDLLPMERNWMCFFNRTAWQLGQWRTDVREYTVPRIWLAEYIRFNSSEYRNWNLQFLFLFSLRFFGCVYRYVFLVLFPSQAVNQPNLCDLTMHHTGGCRTNG